MEKSGIYGEHAAVVGCIARLPIYLRTEPRSFPAYDGAGRNSQGGHERHLRRNREMADITREPGAVLARHLSVNRW
jgi:hypothetical protein